MKLTNDVIILNRPRVQKRGLALNLNGRITLRSSPCKLLDLHPGDKICFCFSTPSKQMYVIKSPPALEAKYVSIKMSHRNETINLDVDGVSCPALAIVNRADSEHCR